MGWLYMVDDLLWPATILASVMIFALSFKKPLSLFAQALLERQKAQLQQVETEHARWLEEKRELDATHAARVKSRNAELAKNTAEAELAYRMIVDNAGYTVERRRKVIEAETHAEIREAPKTAAARKAAEIRMALLERLITEHDKYVTNKKARGQDANALGPWLAQLPERFLK